MKKADRDQRYEALHQIGCVCCLLNHETGFFRLTKLPTEIHHQNAGGVAGGKRLGDEFTIPLCSWHHRGSITPVAAPGGFVGSEWAEGMAKKYGPSWAQGSKRFHEEYPSDDELLDLTNRLLPKTEAFAWT
jgi:hypothetical protein